MNVTISSIQERLERYYTQLSTTRAGPAVPAVLAAFALYVARKFFQHRKRVAARRAWSNTSKEVAVVTGGSGGIGIEVVKQLSARGVKVAILDVASPPASVLCDTVRFYKTDITEYDSILAVSESIRENLGPVTMLVNNAGMAHEASIIEAEPSRTKRLIEVNLTSHFYTLKIFLPHMVRTNHGHVMTVASAGSFTMPAGHASYGATKIAVMSLDETLRLELELLYQNRTGVHCSVVHPFWIKTPMTENLFQKRFYEAMTEPQLVGKKMAEQLLSGQGGSLCIPGWIGKLVFIRALPHNWQHSIRKYFHLDTMKNRIENNLSPPMP